MSEKISERVAFARHAASNHLSFGTAKPEAVTPEAIASKATAMYRGYLKGRDITVEEATAGLRLAMEQKGMKPEH